MLQKTTSHVNIVAGLCMLVISAVVISACGQTAPTSTPTPAPTATIIAPTATSVVPTPMTIEILQLAETGNYHNAITVDLGDITWSVVTQTNGISGEAEAKTAVLEAIKAEGSKLAAVDYAALSLETFKDVTRQLHLSADSFVGGDTRLEEVGRQNGSDTWLLYDYKGPDIPQMPERPQVFRWVQVYALYNVTKKSVVRLLVTVHGEAQE